jgi:hypothetical protein
MENRWQITVFHAVARAARRTLSAQIMIRTRIKLGNLIGEGAACKAVTGGFDSHPELQDSLGAAVQALYLAAGQKSRNHFRAAIEQSGPIDRNPQTGGFGLAA